MSFLQVQSLSKSYSDTDKWAVNKVAFEVEQGQFISIVGESGCGKSTLLRMIQGIEQPNEGQIILDGERVKGPMEVLVAGHSEIALVHQKFDLFPNHKIPELLSFKLRKYHQDYEAERIEIMLDLCRLREFVDRKPIELSGGQQQRVALAYALCDQPSLLLLDEPFSSIDSPHRRELRPILHDIIESTGVTAIMVTHDGQDALSMSDEILMMNSGSMTQRGTPQQIYDTPDSLYTAQFFGELNKVGKNQYVRISDTSITENPDGQWKVRQVSYFGHYSIIEVSKGRARARVIDNTMRLKVGSKADINFAEGKTMKF